MLQCHQMPVVLPTEQGTKPKGKGGRPTIFTQDLADLICAELAQGKSLRTVLKSKSMPAMSQIFNWLRTNTEFQEQYTRAKEEGADALADDIIDIAADVRRGKLKPDAGRVAGDLMKWSASKLKPKKYGDKLDLTTGNEKLNRGMSDAELNAILARERTAADKASQSPQA